MAQLSRKQFIESHGATCENWTWSWSFVNHKERFVIFGAWDVYDSGNKSLILDEAWKISRKGRKQPGYPQSREHVRLVEEEAYKLYTFPMKYATSVESDESAPARIEGFAPELRHRSLLRVGAAWYASDDRPASRIPEEVAPGRTYHEGAARLINVNAYERSASARAACIAHYGYKCVVCGFSFEARYGELGMNYIHVHHVVPLSEVGGEYVVDAVRDLRPVCPNCHCMLHATEPALTIEQLKMLLKDEPLST